MKTTLKYALPLAGVLMFAACGDDNSSSPEQSGGKYILDEGKQKLLRGSGDRTWCPLEME